MKVEIRIARGKKLYDKRAAEKQRVRKRERLGWVKLNLKGKLQLHQTDDIIFELGVLADVGNDAERACRGQNTSQIQLQTICGANDDNYTRLITVSAV